MPATPSPVGSKGPLNPWWNAVISKLQQLQADVTALQAGSQQTVTVDQYGNAIIVAGQLNQIVTIGAKFGQAGVLVGTALPTGSNPNAGLAVQQSLATTTITTTQGSRSATVGSGTGLAAGMVIGAADVSDPTSGVATPAITPGTTISSIAGTSVTLSQNAAENGSGLYCAACYFEPLTSAAIPTTTLAANDAPVWNGSTWVSSQVLQSTNNLSDLGSVPTALSNLGFSRVSRAYMSAAVAVPAAATWELVPLNTIDTDADITFNTTTHVFTVPRTGRYQITGTVYATNNTGAAVIFVAGIWHNGNPTGISYARDDAVPNTGNWARSFSENYALTANDTIGLAFYTSSIAGFGVPWGADNCILSIMQVPG